MITISQRLAQNLDDGISFQRVPGIPQRPHLEPDFFQLDAAARAAGVGAKEPDDQVTCGFDVLACGLS